MIGGISRTFLAGVLSLLVLASASADASTARPPVALTATPAHVAIAGTGSSRVRITNAGASQVAVDVVRAGFALDLRGRPRVVARRGTGRSAADWLTFRPRSLVLRPGSSGMVTITSRIPARVEPGDHDALVLFTTRRRVRGGLAVRVRMGVVVVVRAPGTIVRNIAVGGLRVIRGDRGRILQLALENRGNVSESFSRSRARISVFRDARRIALVRAAPRELRPRTRGVLEFRAAAGLVGSYVARVDVASDSGQVIRRTFRVRM